MTTTGGEGQDDDRPYAELLADLNGVLGPELRKAETQLRTVVENATTQFAVSSAIAALLAGDRDRAGRNLDALRPAAVTAALRAAYEVTDLLIDRSTEKGEVDRFYASGEAAATAEQINVSSVFGYAWADDHDAVMRNLRRMSREQVEKMAFALGLLMGCINTHHQEEQQ